jgi:ubiquitin carboxyl-terminal hydrolase 12/46
VLFLQILQALYFCEPFRERVLEYRKQSKKTDGSLIWCLADLFNQLAAKKKRQPIKPTKFVHMLKKENDAFDNVLQHDAQEFLNFLLNHIGDTLRDEIVRNQKVSQTQSDAHQHNSPCDYQETWVHELFEVHFL